jgi:iron-sulfur cluster repair protein YtfE (RIC family)
MPRLQIFNRDREDDHSAQSTPRRYAPGTELSYDPALPGRLRHQQREILAVLERAAEAAAASRFKQVLNLLLEFRRDYQQHLYEKNLRLFPYLNHCLADDPKHNGVVMKVSSVTRRLDHKVMAMVNNHQVEITSAKREAFLAELATLKAELSRHMSEEGEYIYPMYIPPESYRVN